MEILGETQFTIRQVDREPLYAQWKALRQLIYFLDHILYGQPFHLTRLTYERGSWQPEPYQSVMIRGFVQGPQLLIEAFNEGEEPADYRDYVEQREAVQRLVPHRHPTYGPPWRLLADELRELQMENRVLCEHVERLKEQHVASPPS